MSHDDRRARARRRAWGRGPSILRFEPLEGRQLLSIADPIAEIASAAGADVATTSTVDTTSDATTADIGTAADLAAQSGATVLTTSAPVATTTTATTAPKFDGSNLVASAFDTLHNLDWGDAFRAVGSVRNLGSTPTPVAYDLNVYASTRPTLGPDAQFVGKVDIPAGVAAGARTDFDTPLTAPRVPLVGLGKATSYYLIPQLVAESGPKALAAATAGTPLSSVVTVTPKVPPKLVGAGLAVNPGSIAWGDAITVTASVKNDSQGVAPPTNARIVLTPAGKTPGGGWDYQIGQVPIPPVGAFQTVTASQKITLPNYAPTLLASTSQYTVTMIQDADASASLLLNPAPSTTAGNTTKLTIATPAGSPAAAPVNKPKAADLTLTDVQEPSPTMFRGATFPVGATVRNNGPGDAGPFKVRFLLVTDESADAPALVLGDASLPGLGAGLEQDVLQIVTLPYRTPGEFAADSPTARIVAQVDPDRSVDQANTANDSLAAPRVQLKVLSADGQTTVPVLPGSTATTTPKGTTATTPATAAGTGSGFTTTTVAAEAVPVVTTTTTTTVTTTTTTKPAPTKTTIPRNAANLAARRAAAQAKRKELAAKRAAAQAKARAQVIAHRGHALPKPKATPRAQPLRVFRPGAGATQG